MVQLFGIFIGISLSLTSIPASAGVTIELSENSFCYAFPTEVEVPDPKHKIEVTNLHMTDIVYRSPKETSSSEARAWCGLFQTTKRAAERATQDSVNGHAVVLDTSKNPDEENWVQVAPEGAVVPHLTKRLEELESRVESLEAK